VSIRGLSAVDLDVYIGDTPVLRGIEFVALSSRWMTITGPSGAGKSILLQTLAGLLPVRHGAVLVDGHPAWTGPDRQPAPGIVLQNYALVPSLTAAETVSLPLQARRVAKGDIRRRTGDWLGALGLAATADQLISNLSGGQRQRVAIARTLAIDAPLLFLDEPTAELDPANRQLVLTLLRERADRGDVLVVVSHDPAVLELSDTVWTLTPEGSLTT
jgi:putative ABC transport system ATP-binding protein